ncbi:MAG: TonB-dependent receptor [Sphingobium sp.]|nr:TonB-dependent receptor [Sphingobium sp.]
MRIRLILQVTTALTAGVAVNTAISPVFAQDNADTEAQSVVVVGVRGSAETAVKKKRGAKQLVDSVVAEDVGKLPDNNVPEALSRVTGVQIDRARGQGQGVTIRGLSEIQTTVNGNQTNLGEGRSLNLADIPAELLKSVDVYKTRTPDQVEGGIAGTVNVDLRRPLDLQKGWTIAGSVKGGYDDIADKVSPSGSLLIADRFETNIGEMGFLINGAWSRLNYRENYIESESPRTIPERGAIDPNSPNPPGADQLWYWGMSDQMRNAIIPYRAQYGLESGHRTQPSINAAFQWKPSDQLEFVLEGGYIGSREKRSIDRVYVQLWDGNPIYSNVGFAADGKTIDTLTISNPNGIPARVDGQYNSFYSDLYTSNFEAKWHNDRAEIRSSVQYNWSKDGNYFVQQIIRPGNNLTSATVDFTSDIHKNGVPSITLHGVDLADSSGYGVERFQDNRGRSKNREFAAQTDLTLRTSDTGFIRSLQTGFRYNRRNTSRIYGYRDGFPRVNGEYAPLSAFPGGSDLAMIGPDFGTGFEWYRIPGSTVLSNIDAIRQYIQTNDPGNAGRFSTQFPSGDQGQEWGSIEKNFAFYGQANYGFNIGSIPVDGVVGARYTNSWGSTNSTIYNVQSVAQPDGTNIVVETREPSSGRGNYYDILPSASAVIHFTPQMQVRLSYSTNVQRPSFYDMRPFYVVDTVANPPVVIGGNPELKAQKEQSFNISGEYYFGRGGMVSLAGYYKKAKNFLYYSREAIADLSAYGVTGSGFLEQQRNAGDGKFAGIEGTVQSFFDFLPGIWKNFGVNLNASYIGKARIEYPYPEDFPGAFDSPNTSKWTANATLFYDTPQFSARVAYNYRSSYRMGVYTDNPEYSPYNDKTQRLDAAINFTPVKFMTLSVEGTNLLKNDVYRYFGQDKLLPLGVRTLARTVQTSVRFRF